MLVFPLPALYSFEFWFPALLPFSSRSLKAKRSVKGFATQIRGCIPQQKGVVMSRRSFTLGSVYSIAGRTFVGNPINGVPSSLKPIENQREQTLRVQTPLGGQNEITVGSNELRITLPAAAIAVDITCPLEDITAVLLPSGELFTIVHELKDLRWSPSSADTSHLLIERSRRRLALTEARFFAPYRFYNPWFEQAAFAQFRAAQAENRLSRELTEVFVACTRLPRHVSLDYIVQSFNTPEGERLRSIVRLDSAVRAVRIHAKERGSAEDELPRWLISTAANELLMLEFSSSETFDPYDVAGAWFIPDTVEEGFSYYPLLCTELDDYTPLVLAWDALTASAQG